jgi:hypothetical protein
VFLHRLRAITVSVPSVGAVRGFSRDRELAETSPGCFETSDGGEQPQRVEVRRHVLAAQPAPPRVRGIQLGTAP